LGAQRLLKKWVTTGFRRSQESIYFCRRPDYLFLLHQEFEVIGVCNSCATFTAVEKVKISLVSTASHEHYCANIAFGTSKYQPPIKYLVNSN
jgi:hypothetical protein